jgi:serine/threonine protein kinase
VSIEPGVKLGRYEIRAKIGASGMGEVYLAQDTELNRKVALKILPSEVAANHDRMEFNREAKAAAALVAQEFSQFSLLAVEFGPGRKDKALEQPNRAFEDHAGWIIFLNVERLFDPIRSDPRFIELVSRMKFQR